MLRSMFSSVVGLRAMQTRLDVIGDNIANVNTPGFKASRVTFANMFSETLRNGGAPANGGGGSNPMQIGLGTTLASVDQIMAAGTMQLTGRTTDMAIQGSGFFVLAKGQERLFTRAGNFNRDLQGFLVNPSNGFRLQGWMANRDGTFPVKDGVNLTDIQISNSEVQLATATSLVQIGGSLNASAPAASAASTSVSAFDSLGREHTILINFNRGAGNTWTWSVASADPELNMAAYGATNQGGVSFANDGSLTGVTGGVSAAANARGQAQIRIPVTGANDLEINLDFNKLTQPALPGTTASDVRIFDRNGNAMGALDSFFVDQTGILYGVFTNGQRRPLAQVALANFSNPEGLLRQGANSYTVSSNSGLEQIGEPGTGGRGTIVPSSLEASNVDLAAEFTNMITTQRAYQANSRIITASDELLQDLVNMKR